MFVVRVSFLWVDGMALFPVVLVRKPNPDPVLLNHERIHLRQQLEMGILLFYLCYLLEYVYRLFQYRNHYRAYRHISFEREAFANDANLRYLATRPAYAFRHYWRRRGH